MAQPPSRPKARSRFGSQSASELGDPGRFIHNATSVLLAASPLLEGISGLYFENCNEAQVLTKRPSDFTGGYAGHALDPENAERLWNLSMKLIS